MKKIIIILLLLMIILNKMWIQQEGFTPGLRRIYRPYVRHTRVTTESFLTDKSTVISNMFRRFGIL